LDWQSFLERAPFMAACKGKFIVLESSEAMRDALRRNDFAMILNPYGEMFPSMSRENLPADLDLVKDYVKKGGVWWEVGGYSFYTIIEPEPYMAVSETYTSAVADFTFLDYGKNGGFVLMGIPFFIGIVLGGLPDLLAVAFGIAGISRAGRIRRGMGAAVTGLVLGSVSLLSVFLGAGWLW
jgi:hypothetical protein